MPPMMTYPTPFVHTVLFGKRVYLSCEYADIFRVTAAWWPVQALDNLEVAVVVTTLMASTALYGCG